MYFFSLSLYIYIIRHHNNIMAAVRLIGSLSIYCGWSGAAGGRPGAAGGRPGAAGGRPGGGPAGCLGEAARGGARGRPGVSFLVNPSAPIWPTSLPSLRK